MMVLLLFLLAAYLVVGILLTTKNSHNLKREGKVKNSDILIARLIIALIWPGLLIVDIIKNNLEKQKLKKEEKETEKDSDISHKVSLVDRYNEYRLQQKTLYFYFEEFEIKKTSKGLEKNTNQNIRLSIKERY